MVICGRSTERQAHHAGPCGESEARHAGRAHDAATARGGACDQLSLQLELTRRRLRVRAASQAAYGLEGWHSSHASGLAAARALEAPRRLQRLDARRARRGWPHEPGGGPTRAGPYGMTVRRGKRQASGGSVAEHVPQERCGQDLPEQGGKDALRRGRSTARRGPCHAGTSRAPVRQQPEGADGGALDMWMSDASSAATRDAHLALPYDRGGAMLAPPKSRRLAHDLPWRSRADARPAEPTSRRRSCACAMPRSAL